MGDGGGLAEPELQMADNVALPTCVATMICDEIFRDERTKKMILVGTFTSIQTPRLPCRHRKMCILFTLTGVNGEYDLSLSVEHAESGETLVEVRGPMRGHNPLAITEHEVHLGEIDFAAEGKYWVVVRINGQIIGQRPFRVIMVKPAEDADDAAAAE